MPRRLKHHLKHLPHSNLGRIIIFVLILVIASVLLFLAKLKNDEGSWQKEKSIGTENKIFRGPTGAPYIRGPSTPPPPTGRPSPINP